MNAQHCRRLAATAGILVCSALAWPIVAAEPAAAPAAATGDLWEVTTRMSMPGMPMQMPAQKSQVCSAREWKEPPAAADPHHPCTNSDFKVVGSKATWKTVCPGPPEMTGTGEITRDGDSAYSGTITLAAPQGSMTMKLDGKKIGACDPTKK